MVTVVLDTDAPQSETAEKLSLMDKLRSLCCKKKQDDGIKKSQLKRYEKKSKLEPYLMQDFTGDMTDDSDE